MALSIHRAMWLTYVCHQRRTPPDALPDGLKVTTVELLTALTKAQNEKSIHPSLLAIGLFNLLRAFEGLEEDPDLYDKLHNTVYGWGAQVNRETYRNRRAPVFPHDPQQIVIEPELETSDDLDGSTVKLDFCLQQNLESLKTIVEPLAWSRRKPFWSEKFAPTDGKVAELSLPLVPVPPAQEGPKVQIRITADKSDSPFELRNDYELKEAGANASRIEMCRGSLSLKKESGRPGLTRLILQRTVRFKPGPFNEHRLSTLLYWVHAEIVSLVFPEFEPTKPKPSTPALKLPAGVKKPPKKIKKPAKKI